VSASLSRQNLALAVRKYGLAYLFIAPVLLASVAFLLIPMLTSLWWSFNDYTGLQPPTFVGLNNYIELLKNDDIFHKALWNTTLFVIMGMSLGPTLGILTAVLLDQKVRFQSLFRTAYFLPVMTSLVVVSTLWRVLYNQNGLLNSLFTTLGLGSVGWLSDPNVALVSLVIASVWQGFGFETVVFLAALQTIPRELYEAAMIDGAGPWSRFRFITLPSLRPVILFAYIVGVIGSYQVFDQVFVMTRGGPIYSTTSIVYYLFTKFQDLRLGYASAIAYLLFVILVLFSLIQWRYFGEREDA